MSFTGFSKKRRPFRVSVETIVIPGESIIKGLEELQDNEVKWSEIRVQSAP